MFKMIFAGMVLFGLSYGGVKAIQHASDYEFESLINEVSVAAGVSAVVIFLIAAIVILF